jgi:predicted ThiF/HesA family dinucleotide-utilizing enzyme
MNSPVVFTSEQLTILNTLNQKYLSGEILSFNTSNTATGTNSVTINERSGVAIFTDTVDSLPTYTTFTINNSLITASSIVNVFIASTDADDSFATIVSMISSNGQIIIGVTDIVGNGSSITKFGFQILS